MTSEDEKLKHTVGPWEVVKLSGVSGPHSIRMAYSGEKTFYGVRQIHREADARLIAAAPELLAHLQFAVKLLSAFPAMSGSAQVEAMRTAIAKATGDAS